MATRKGKIATVGILAAITIASFVFWFIPQNVPQTIVVSDFQSHLDGVKEIHQLLSTGIDEEFEKMKNGDLMPDEYIAEANVSSSHVNSQIISLVESKAPDEWVDSYTKYIESLRSFNSQIRETIVYANMIKDGVSEDRKSEILEKIEVYRNESRELIAESDLARPQ